MSMANGDLVVVGLISGTSADGIDGVVAKLPANPALVDVEGLTHHHVHLTGARREAVFAAFDTARATADILCQLNFQVGEWFAEAALATIEAAGLRPEHVDVIASHGQTIYHDPPRAVGHIGSTLQVGEPAVIAERCGVTTVADFRVRDMAAGGHGAPLVSFLDDLLFRPETGTRVLLNLGGIGNVTMLPPRHLGDTVARVACDTGPSNMVLDWIVEKVTGGAERFDRDGAIARSGTVDLGWLAHLMDDDYFRAPAPKTTGRERYGAAFAEVVLADGRARGLATRDIVATVTALTGATVADCIVANTPDGYPLTEVVAGGGGAHNPAIMAEIARRLPGVALSSVDDFGIPSQAKEALLFALLGNAAVRGLVNTVPSSTGARHATVMGKIVPGANYRALMARLFG
jgi:anhydro-N-acetylmuramic acid kinase